MGRYYFHLRNSETIDDEEGAEFVSRGAAHDHAVRAARELLAEGVRSGEITLSHFIEMVGDDGSSENVRFGDVLRIHP